MKLQTSLVLLIGSLFRPPSESEPQVGMTEKKWLRDAVLSDPTYLEAKVHAYRSNRLYYYFLNGVLVKIDESWISAKKIEELFPPTPTLGGKK